MGHYDKLREELAARDMREYEHACAQSGEGFSAAPTTLFGHPIAQEADRYNKGKIQYSLLDLNSLEQCAKVLEFGAKKYSRDNWKKGMPVSKILDSLLRHIARLQVGEIIDPESGLPHLGHIQCNAMFLGNPVNTQDIKVLEEVDDEN